MNKANIEYCQRQSSKWLFGNYQICSAFNTIGSKYQSSSLAKRHQALYRKSSKNLTFLLAIMLMTSLLSSCDSQSDTDRMQTDATSTSIASHGQQIRSTQQAQQKKQPTQKPTEQPKIQKVNLTIKTHGRPRMGGPISDFVGKYQLVRDDSPYGFIDGEEIGIGVELKDNKVDHILVSGPESWSHDKSMQYCIQFGADGMKIRGGPDTIKLFDSDMGQFSIIVVDGGGCTINFGE